MVRLSPRLRPLFPYLKPAYTLTTRAVGPATRALSRARRGPLPTGVAWTMEDAAKDDGEFVLVRPPTVERRQRPVGMPADLSAFDDVAEEVPRVGVLELRNARVMPPHSLVVTNRGRLLHDQCWYFGTAETRPYDHPVFLRPTAPPPRSIVGRVGVLASRGDSNYYHYLHDCLPRLAVLEQSGDAPPDLWYVPQSLPFQRELLDLLGVPSARRLDSVEAPHIEAERLVVPGLPSDVIRNPAWVSRWLADRLRPSDAQLIPGRRLYLTRGQQRNNRIVRNEEAVVDRLARLGFERIDPGRLAVADQIRLFAEAEVIVAPHGASLANLSFCSPGATVLELFPAGGAVSCYWKLASGVPGLEYRYLCGEGSSKGRSRFEFLVADIDVDLPALEVMVERLLAERTVRAARADAAPQRTTGGSSLDPQGPAQERELQ